MSDVCVIGAGVCGLVMCKSLKQHGISYDCYEKGSKIGGNWWYNNDNNQSSIYHSLHINSSKKMTEFEDFPMPEDFPHFPNHTQILKYLEDFCNHFKLLDNIKFNITISNIEKNNDGTFKIEYNGLKKNYKYVIVATGHHWKPYIPKSITTSNFNGQLLHSHDYKTPNEFKGRSVLVVGIGNSALDIACDISRNNNDIVYISTRNSAHIFPHFFLGRPIGDIGSKSPIWIPTFLKRIITHIILYLARGNQKNYNIPKPKFKLLTQHPSISSEIFLLAGKGLIKFLPDLKSINNQEITFENETLLKIDTILVCTGYDISLPFIHPEILDNEELENTNKLDLYKRIVPTNHNNIFFIGFVQPNASIFKIAEIQSKWVTNIIMGEISLPNVDDMKKEILEYEAKKNNTYQVSRRHSIQVDAKEYIKSLNKDLKL